MTWEFWNLCFQQMKIMDIFKHIVLYTYHCICNYTQILGTIWKTMSNIMHSNICDPVALYLEHKWSSILQIKMFWTYYGCSSKSLLVFVVVISMWDRLAHKRGVPNSHVFSELSFCIIHEYCKKYDGQPL